MKVFEMTSAGGPDVLRYAERPTPEPGFGQVLIDVRYAGLNFTDVLARRGLPAYSTGFPFVPGMETAGTLVEVGPGVTGLSAGDTVIAFTVDGGGLAAQALASAALTVPVPAGLSLDRAVVAPLTWATALGLTRVSQASAGDAVLVTSAAGGVGEALAVMLKRAGVTKLAGGVRHSAADDYVAVPRDGDLFAAATAALGVPELDVVLESVGGKILAGAASALAVGGRLVTYGVAGGEPDPAPPGYGELRVGNHTVTGFSIMAQARKKPDSVRRLLLDVLSATEAGLEIPAPIVVSWDDARQAHIDQSEGRSRGKSIVDIQS
jgi:NADPH2:quinone reductase